MNGRCLLVIALTGLTWVVNWPSSTRADPPRPQVIERLWKIVLNRPRRGTAFDRLYRYYANESQLDALQRRLRARAKADRGRPAGWMVLAMVHAKRSRFAAAEKALRQAAMMAPRDYYVRFLQAELDSQQFRLPQAAKGYSASLELNPPRSEFLSIAKKLTRIYLRLGRKSKAAQLSESLLKRFPGDVRLLQQLAQLLSEEGDTKAAVVRWEQLIQLAKDDQRRLKAHLAIARLDHRDGRTTKAIERLASQLSGVAPGSFFAGEIRRQINETFLLPKRNQAGLIAFWRQRTASQPDEVESRIELANILLRVGNAPDGESELRQVIKRSPSHATAHRSLTRSLVRGQHWPEAIAAALDWTAKRPADQRGWETLGQVYLMSKAKSANDRRTKVLQAVKAWEHLSGDDAVGALRVAELCAKAIPRGAAKSPAQQVLIQGAEKHYRMAVERAKSPASYLEFLGTFLHDHGRSAEALSVWQKMTTSKSTALSWERLATLLRRHRHYKEALNANRMAISREPAEFRHVLNELVILKQLKRTPEATKQLPRLRELIRNAQQRREFIRHFTDIYQTDDQFLAEGIDKLRWQILVFDAGSRGLELRLLAELLSRSQQMTEATRRLQQAVEEDPQQLTARLKLAEIYEGLGNLRAAVAQLREVAKGQATASVTLYRRIVELELRGKRVPQARQAADELVVRLPSATTGYLMRARVALLEKKYDDALDNVRRARQIAPQNLPVRLQLVATLRTMRDLREARRQLWLCLDLATSLRSKQQIVSDLASLSRTSQQRGQLLDRVTWLRDTTSDRRAWSLVHARLLQQFRNPNFAQRQLDEVLASNPNDAEALILAVQIAENAKNWPAALRYQARLAEVRTNPANLETLANLYDRNKQPARAIATWKRLLTTRNDLAETQAVVQSQFRRGNLAVATELSDWGVLQHNRPWQLLYLSGYLYLGQNNLSVAQAYFEELSDLEGKRPSHKGSVPYEIELFSQSTATWKMLRDVAKIFAGREVRVRRATRIVRRAIPVPVSQSNAVMASVMARFRMARKQNRVQELMNGFASRRERWLLENLVLTATEMNDRDLIRKATSAATRMDPENAVPHVARLMHLERNLRANELGDTSGWIGSVKSSFQWLEQNRPALYRYLLQHPQVREVRQFKVQVNRHFTSAIGPEGKLLVSVDQARRKSILVRLWEIESGKLIRSFKGHNRQLLDVAFSPTGKHIASAGVDGARVWEVATGKQLHFEKGRCYRVAFDATGERFACAMQAAALVMKLNGQQKRRLRAIKQMVCALSFSPDGKYLAVGARQRGVTIWDPDAGKRLHTLGVRQAYTVNFSHNGKRLAIAARGYGIIYDVKTWRALRVLRGHKGSVFTVAFSADDARLVTAGSDSTVRIWNANSGKLQLTLRQHTKAAYSASYSPTEHLLVSTSHDGTIRVFRGMQLPVLIRELEKKGRKP